MGFLYSITLNLLRLSFYVHAGRLCNVPGLRFILPTVTTFLSFMK
jgi:hypothetical protein